MCVCVCVCVCVCAQGTVWLLNYLHICLFLFGHVLIFFFVLSFWPRLHFLCNSEGVKRFSQNIMKSSPLEQRMSSSSLARLTKTSHTLPLQYHGLLFYYCYIQGNVWYMCWGFRNSKYWSPVCVQEIISWLIVQQAMLLLCWCVCRVFVAINDPV